MEISNLKELKEALKDIPDEVLENFGAGIDEEDGQFVGLLCWDSSDPHEAYGIHTEKYPVLEDIGKWIGNIAQVQDQSEKQEELGTEEPISSKDKIEIKP